MSLSYADLRPKAEDHRVEASLSRGLCCPTYEIQYSGLITKVLRKRQGLDLSQMTHLSLDRALHHG